MRTCVGSWEGEVMRGEREFGGRGSERMAAAAMAAAEVKKTQHTSWVQTGLYLSYEIVFASLHPHYDPAPVSAWLSVSFPDRAVKEGTPLDPKLASSQGLALDLWLLVSCGIESVVPFKTRF